MEDRERMFTAPCIPKANVTRLYVPRKIGGRALLVLIEDCMASERRTLDCYLASSNETILKYVVLHQGLDEDTIETKTTYHKITEDEKTSSWIISQTYKRSEGRKFKEMANKVRSQRESESVLKAAQDQALKP